jgi:hypothetical protein
MYIALLPNLALTGGTTTLVRVAQIRPILNHANELMRAVYLGWYLQRAGYGHQPAEQFKITECAETTLARAHETGDWRLAPEAISDFEALLALYDAQLESVPLHKVLEAESRLRAFLAGTGNSLISLPT